MIRKIMIVRMACLPIDKDGTLHSTTGSIIARLRCASEAVHIQSKIFPERRHDKSPRRHRGLSASFLETARMSAPPQASTTARAKASSPNEPAARTFARPLADPGYNRIVRLAQAAFATFSSVAVSIARM